MKKNGNSGVFLLLGLGLVGAVGALAVSRGGVTLPGVLPAGGAGSVPTDTDTGAGSGTTPMFSVRYPRFADRYGYGGLLVTSGGGTRTPTMSSDPTPTSGTDADTPVSAAYGGSFSSRYGGY